MSDRQGEVVDFYSKPDVVRFYAHSTAFPVERVLFERFVTSGSRVLDIGVGAGRTTAELAPRAATYLGVDISQAMVDAARAAHPGVDIRCMSATNLVDFDDASFDVVVFSFNGIDHLSDGERVDFYREAHRLLADGGALIHSRHSARQLVVWPRVVWRAPRRTGRELASAAKETGRRLVRSWRSESFRCGTGEYADSSLDGAMLQVTTPAVMAGELRHAGFVVGAVRSRRGRRVRFGFTQPWFYNSATRPGR